MMQCIRKCGIVVIVLWACSLKKEASFVVLLAQLGLVWFSRVSRLSKVRVGIRVSVRIRLWVKCRPAGMQGACVTTGKMRGRSAGTTHILPTCSVITKAIARGQCALSMTAMFIIGQWPCLKLFWPTAHYGRPM